MTMPILPSASNRPGLARAVTDAGFEVAQFPESDLNGAFVLLGGKAKIGAHALNIWRAKSLRFARLTSG